MIVKDIWGNVQVGAGYEKIINSKEFLETKNKRQLGMANDIGTNHTRYEHMIGAFYLSGILVDTLINKFHKILTITDEDIAAVRIALLCHDIGHAAYSHATEITLDGDHEENTRNILKRPTSEIHKAIIANFGEEVLAKVLYILGENNILVPEDSLIYIVKNFIDGALDLDRMDFLYRDNHNMNTGECDFTSIIDAISLEMVNGRLEIVFDADENPRVFYKIMEMLAKRFESYDLCYYALNRITEALFAKFIKEANLNFTWDTTESELKEIFRRYMNSSDLVLKRYAKILYYLNSDEHVLIKAFEGIENYHKAKRNLFDLVPVLNRYPECVYELDNIIKMLKPTQKIYIKKNGEIKDIREFNTIFNHDVVKEKGMIGIDLELLRALMERDKYSAKEIKSTIKKITKFYKDGIEKEEKYTFNELSCDAVSEFKQIRDYFKLSSAKFKKQDDTYFTDLQGILDAEHIKVRRRVEGHDEEYTIKKPVEYSGITKRWENDYGSLEEIENTLKVGSLKPRLNIKNKKVKYILEYKGSIIELSFDKSIPVFEGDTYKANYMIECELISGSSSSLYFLNQELLSKFPFLSSSSLAKEDIALEAIAKGEKKDMDTKEFERALVRQ